MKRDILLATIGFLGLGVSLTVGGYALYNDWIARAVLIFCGVTAIFFAGAVANNDATIIGEQSK